jgi:hypothetical protein
MTNNDSFSKKVLDLAERMFEHYSKTDLQFAKEIIDLKEEFEKLKNSNDSSEPKVSNSEPKNEIIPDNLPF